MIKDKLHTLSDKDAIKVAEILLKSSTSILYNFNFLNIQRYQYDVQHGVDAEESINLCFKATVKNEIYKKSGWKDKEIMIMLIEKDNYHDYPYFSAQSRAPEESRWTDQEYISNYIEAIEFLQKINII